MTDKPDNVVVEEPITEEDKQNIKLYYEHLKQQTAEFKPSFLGIFSAEKGATFNLLFSFLCWIFFGLMVFIDYGYNNAINPKEKDLRNIPSGSRGSGGAIISTVLFALSLIIFILKAISYFRKPDFAELFRRQEILAIRRAKQNATK